MSLDEIKKWKEIRQWIDEQLAAGKTQEEIDEMCVDNDEEKHAKRVRDEDNESIKSRGY